MSCSLDQLEFTLTRYGGLRTQTSTADQDHWLPYHQYCRDFVSWNCENRCHLSRQSNTVEYPGFHHGFNHGHRVRISIEPLIIWLTHDTHSLLCLGWFESIQTTRMDWLFRRDYADMCFSQRHHRPRLRRVQLENTPAQGRAVPYEISESTQSTVIDKNSQQGVTVPADEPLSNIISNNKPLTITGNLDTGPATDLPSSDPEGDVCPSTSVDNSDTSREEVIIPDVKVMVTSGIEIASQPGVSGRCCLRAGAYQELLTVACLDSSCSLHGWISLQNMCQDIYASGSS